MTTLVLSFSEFILESKYHTRQPRLAEEYKIDLIDFNYESTILSLINNIEILWIEMEKDYWWNREYQHSLKFPHFALYAKLNYLDLEKVSKIIGDNELNDDELVDIWYNWIVDQREIFIDDLDYSWIENVSWGGKSGGWCLITPNINYDDMLEDITNLLDNYISEKNEIKNNVSNWEYIKSTLEDPESSQLREIGLIEISEDAINLKESGDIVIKTLNENLQETKNLQLDLLEINNRLIKFKQNADSYFYSYLEELIEVDSD